MEMRGRNSTCEAQQQSKEVFSLPRKEQERSAHRGSVALCARKRRFLQSSRRPLRAKNCRARLFARQSPADLPPCPRECRLAHLRSPHNPPAPSEEAPYLSGMALDLASRG